MQSRQLALMVLVISALSGCAIIGADPARRAQRDAERDIKAGRLAVKFYGKPADWAGDYRDILLEDYDVHTDGVAGCGVTGDVLTYANTYNRIMKPEIKRQRGDDIFDIAKARAQKAHAAEYGSEDALHYVTSELKLPQTNDEPSDATEPGMQGFTNGKSTLPAR